MSQGFERTRANKCLLDVTHELAGAVSACISPAQDEANQHSSTEWGKVHEQLCHI